MARGQQGQRRQTISYLPRPSTEMANMDDVFNSRILHTDNSSATWESAERLKHILDIDAIPFNSRLSSLLPGYIPTLSALRDAASDLAFVAFDTESVPQCYKTIDVGLAFLPDINCIQPARNDPPTLERFVHSYSVEAASFKVNGRYHDICDRVDPANRPMPPLDGGDHFVPRERLRFGAERFVDIEDLEAAITNQITQFRRAAPRKRLILVGLSLQTDLERLCLEFPGISRSFSGWVDLSALMKAESLTPANVGSALTAFRYGPKDTAPDVRHQAANDAVRTLAALCALMDPRNLKTLVTRQNQVAGVELASSINHFESRTYRALLHVGDGAGLPASIDSAQKLAFEFRDFHPVGVAVDTKQGRGKQQSQNSYPVATCGCVCFRTNKALQAFIATTNGAIYDSQILSVERAPLPKRIRKQMGKGMKLHTERLSRRRLDDVDWTESFHDMFFEPEVWAEIDDTPSLLDETESTTSGSSSTSTTSTEKHKVVAAAKHVSRLSGFMGKVRRRMSVRRRRESTTSSIDTTTTTRYVVPYPVWDHNWYV